MWILLEKKMAWGEEYVTDAKWVDDSKTRHNYQTIGYTIYFQLVTSTRLDAVDAILYWRGATLTASTSWSINAVPASTAPARRRRVKFVGMRGKKALEEHGVVGRMSRLRHPSASEDPPSQTRPRPHIGPLQQRWH
jgi:hypothetical protein